MKDVTTLIFDLEGVIIDSEPLWSEADNEFLRRHGVPNNAEETKHLMMGTGLVDGAKLLKQLYGLDGEPEELARERREIIKELFKKEIDFVPGFLEFFEAKVKNYPRAVATSLERDFIAAVDARLHLTDMFGDHIYSIEDIGHISKPNPDIFLHAAKQLGVEPAECLVFEDAPNGVAAAKAAGMRCVAITNSVTRERLAGATQIVDAYSEIKL